MSHARRLKECIDFLRSAAADHTSYKAGMQDCNNECSDLEHELELAARLAKERNRVGANLQAVLRRRRECKDIVEVTEPIAEYLASHPKLLDELGRVLGLVRKAERYHANRTYRPKKRRDLTIGHYIAEQSRKD